MLEWPGKREMGNAKQQYWTIGMMHCKAHNNASVIVPSDADCTSLADVFDKLQCGVLQQKVRPSKNREQLLQFSVHCLQLGMDLLDNPGGKRRGGQEAMQKAGRQFGQYSLHGGVHNKMYNGNVHWITVSCM